MSVNEETRYNPYQEVMQITSSDPLQFIEEGSFL
jgi:hypothetical protein